ncbi:Hypothetical protein PHPALM_11748 [Phytophthora palmivora]|uniref:MULE transposase domain-containing protein n=1 Tax=Phytophthora palmivora TaxID=4796 RepID=A0A2P4Y1Q5_9STRA|nr:Hypothetical protein PHPALM_11748 [Phytophthora palmivora]
MQKIVDELVEQDIPAKTIWSMVYEKVNSDLSRILGGLSRRQVLNQTPTLARVQNDFVGVLQFNYSWYDDTKAKNGKSGIERLVGWSRPELRNLLKYDSVHLFVDGTFRCTPKRSHQFVTLMMYDPLTDLFVPTFFTLSTNKTQALYKKMLSALNFRWARSPTLKMWCVTLGRRLYRLFRGDSRLHV